MADPQAHATTRTERGVPSPWAPQSAAATQGLSIQEARKTLDQFKVACRNPSERAARLDELSQILQDAGFRHEMSDILTDALRLDEVNPQAGALWVRRVVSSKVWDRKYPKYLDDLVVRGEIGRRALTELLKYLNNKGKAAVARPLFRKHSRILRQMPEVRALAVGALASSGLYKPVVQWTRDWQDPNTPLSLLYARAMALRGLGRENKAAKVVDAALARDGLAEYPLLGLWKANHEALRKRTETAAKYYAALKPAGWDDNTFCLYYLTRGVIRVQEASRGNRSDAFRSSYARIRDRFGKHRVFRRNWLMRRAYRQCLWRMAVDAGVWWRGLIVPWTSADTWTMILPLLLIPPFQLFLPTYLWRLLRRRHQPSR